MAAAGHGDGKPPRTDPTLQHPRCVFQIAARHFAPLHARDGRARSAASRRRRSCRWPRPSAPRSGPRAHGGVLLRRRLDAAHRRRAEHPRGDDPAAAAGQHRPARRRDPRPPRPRHDPGLDRHPDAVQPPARLPTMPSAEHTTRWPTTSRPTARRRATGPTSEVHRQPAEGVVRRRGDGGERLRLRLDPRGSSATTRTCRCSSAMVDGKSRASSRWARTRPSAAERRSTGRRWPSSTGWSCATSSRPRPPLSGRTPRGRDRRAAARGHRHRGVPPPGRRRTPRRTARFTNTQRLIQWHHQAVDPPGDARSDLWFTYHLGLADPGTPRGHRPRPRPCRVLDLTWDYPTDGPIDEPSAEAGAAGDQRLRVRRRALSAFTDLQDDGSTRLRLLDLLRRAMPTG